MERPDHSGLIILYLQIMYFVLTKAQDIIVALKLALEESRRSYAELGRELGMSASKVHAAVRRLGEAHLLDPGQRARKCDG